MEQADMANEDLAQRQQREDRRYLVTVPVARYYALLVGVFLTALGILGFVPFVTKGGVLLGLIVATRPWNIIHIVTGVPGIALFFWRQGRYTKTYVLLLAFIYLAVFSAGNFIFAHLDNSYGLRFTDIPYILGSAVDAGVMLASALVFALASMQRGDVQTEKFRAYFREQLERYGNERTRLPSA